MKEDKWVGLDTNILVLADDPSSPHHAKAKMILEDAFQGSLQVCISPQILAEYYSVITSSRRMRNPLSITEARERILFLNKSRRIKKVFPKRLTLKKAVELSAQNGIQGARIFDVIYAVTLLENNIRHLLTQNVKDFSFINNLKIENPFH
jgi:predicted nucleic acid-binding protein